MGEAFIGCKLCSARHEQHAFLRPLPLRQGRPLDSLSLQFPPLLSDATQVAVCALTLFACVREGVDARIRLILILILASSPGLARGAGLNPRANDCRPPACCLTGDRATVHCDADECEEAAYLYSGY